MKKQNRYKQVLAAAFLLLYTFIAAPVQLWHHHDAAQQSKTNQAKISKPGESNKQNSECKICQHTYAAYIGEEASFSFDVIVYPSVKNPYPNTGASVVCLDTISNKGPPLV